MQWFTGKHALDTALDIALDVDAIFYIFTSRAMNLKKDSGKFTLETWRMLQQKLVA